VLRDPKFRQALNWGIDKAKMVELAYRGATRTRRRRQEHQAAPVGARRIAAIVVVAVVLLLLRSKPRAEEG